MRLEGLGAVIACVCMASLLHVVSAQVTTRLAFGSCNDLRKDNPLWEAVNEFAPDAWIWLGESLFLFI